MVVADDFDSVIEPDTDAEVGVAEINTDEQVGNFCCLGVSLAI